MFANTFFNLVKDYKFTWEISCCLFFCPSETYHLQLHISPNDLTKTKPPQIALLFVSFLRKNVPQFFFPPVFWSVRIVHLCRRRSDGAFVILKEIPVEQMSRDERLAAQNECQVLKLLNHPNIIEYYENFLEDKALMIAMEYAPG